MTTKCRNVGRPPAVPVKNFVAIMLGRLQGISTKRALEIVNDDPDQASGLLWNLAAVAHSEGIVTTTDFETWVSDQLSERLKSPVPIL